MCFLLLFPSGSGLGQQVSKPFYEVVECCKSKSTLHAHTHVCTHTHLHGECISCGAAVLAHIEAKASPLFLKDSHVQSSLLLYKCGEKKPLNIVPSAKEEGERPGRVCPNLTPPMSSCQSVLLVFRRQLPDHYYLLVLSCLLFCSVLFARPVVILGAMATQVMHQLHNDPQSSNYIKCQAASGTHSHVYTVMKYTFIICPDKHHADCYFA